MRVEPRQSQWSPAMKLDLSPGDVVQGGISSELAIVAHGEILVYLHNGAVVPLTRAAKDMYRIVTNEVRVVWNK